MHSRILVLDDTTPEVENAEYIQDSPSEPDSDLEWFLGYTGFSKGSVPLSFRIDSVDDFWDKMNDDVQEMIAKEGGINAKNWYSVQNRITMKRSFLIAKDGLIYTLPHFLKTVAKDGAEFEIKKFLDYHF